MHLFVVLRRARWRRGSAGCVGPEARGSAPWAGQREWKREWEREGEGERERERGREREREREREV